MKRCAALVIGCLCSLASADLKLPHIFSDHMVLQRETKVKFWGWGFPGEPVEVKGAWGEAASSKVGADGRWSVWIATGKAGGPYDIDVMGRNKIVFKDVLLGEVWVASGQSNMEFHLGDPLTEKGDNATNVSPREVAAATNDRIRLFYVPQKWAKAPEADVDGAWMPCTPQTAAGFSAVAYFYGVALNKKLGVPVGLIDTSVGGTPAEFWTSRPALARIPGHEDAASSPDVLQKRLDQRVAAWQAQLEKDDLGWGKWSAAEYDDSDWKSTPEAQPWSKTELAGFIGAVYYRASFDLPDSWSGKAVDLYMGPIDDADVTFIDGKRVGFMNDWQTPRKYEVPAGLLHAGKNNLTIRVYNGYGEAGFTSGHGEIQLRSANQAIEIHGPWRYKVALDMSHYPPMPSEPALADSMLYNAMVAPIVGYGIKGAIWYQGEANVPRGYEYRDLFAGMIADWRRNWGLGDFPFYWVQIAPFYYGENADGGSQVVRESQLETLRLKNTGMAVITDLVPDLHNIHPTEKREVGERLSRWALSNAYGIKGIETSGPLYKSMRIDGNKVRIRFSHSDGLVLTGYVDGFTVANSAHLFFPAQAKVEDGELVVWSDQVPNPQSVRFGWNDVPPACLFNAAGLPASPFRTDNWRVVTQPLKK